LATADAQQYKLKQSTGVASMKTETTVYVKGARKRTESSGIMGMGGQISIEQCDLQRTIRINDSKKLYLIEPFDNDVEEAAPKPKTASTKAPEKEKTTTPQKGGTITMYHNVTDTGERKKIFGFTARHVWTTQKIMPSPDACMMKDSMIIKTDGWYIDFPNFNCQRSYSGRTAAYGGMQKPDCMDKFVTKNSGKGKLGFPITETRTMIMGGKTTSNEFVTTIETLELSTAKVDSMLFEIPLGYTETKNPEDLQDKINVGAMAKAYANAATQEFKKPVSDAKPAGITRIGVYVPTGDDQLQGSVLQTHLVNSLNNGKIDAVAINSADDAAKYHCDYVLNTNFTKVKSGSKVGGLLKMVKNADPTAGSGFNIDADLTLTAAADGSKKWQDNVSGKYDGKVDEAAMKALDKETPLLLKALK
jgi:hypothetical protein